MTAGAFIMMIITMGTVTFFTAYFFWRVLKIPPHDDRDGSSTSDSSPTIND